jgi:sporulation protein YlmC with PRC-barrel domain
LALILAVGQPGFAAGAGKAEGEGGIKTMPQTDVDRPADRPSAGGAPTSERSMDDKSMKSGQLTAVPRASELIGKDVVNNQNQELGECEDLILSSDGRVSYLIVSRGGVAGVGEKFYAIPWQASAVSFHGDDLRVNISKERFEGAPAFAGWDEFQGGYESRVRAYYGEGKGFEGKSSEGLKEKPMRQTPKTAPSN